MARGKERAFLARLLRESVLTLCRETMDSHRRFIVDGIVCISLEDDNSGDDLSPIVVTIHEQLPKVSDNDSPSPPLRDPYSPPSDMRDTSVRHRSTESEGEEGKEERQKVPMDKKTRILRRVLQAEAKWRANDASRHSTTPLITSQRHSIGEPVPAKLPRLQEEEEEHRGRDEAVAVDGHVSDPTPLATRSLSQCSAGSDKGDRWRGSMSSPASSDLSSSTYEDVSVVGRPGSASPQDDPKLPFILARHSLPHRPSRLLSRNSHASLGTYGRRDALTCRQCRIDLPDIFALDGHNRREHSLFTCLQCLMTFPTAVGFKNHMRLHAMKSSKYGSGHMLFSRRDGRQRHMHVCLPQARHRRRQELSCSLCSFVGKRYSDLTKHLLSHVTQNGLSATSKVLTHSVRNGYTCSPCAMTFADPVTYTVHVERHSKDPNFHLYRCCYCPDVLRTYDSFMIHQQAHALQVQPSSECGKHFRTAAHFREHVTTHVNRSDHASPRPQSVDACFNGNDARARFEDKHTDGGDSKEDTIPKEDADGQDSGQEASSGSQQSWCTECHMGFPDEDKLIDHITDTHDQDDRLSQDNDQNSGSEHMDTSKDAMDKVEERKRQSAPRGKDMGKEAGEQASGSENYSNRHEATSEKTMGVEDGDRENEGTAQTFLSRREVLESQEMNQSSHDADSATARVLSSLHSARKSSPLRIIPLPLTLGEVAGDDTARVCSVSNSMSGSHITLVKPKDLIIRADTYSRDSSLSPGSLTLSNGHRAGMKRSSYSLLTGPLQSITFNGLAKLGAGIKEEPVLDVEQLHETSSLHPGLLVSGKGLDLSYTGSDPARHSPELPTDLSLPRASSTSPGSVTTDSSRSPGFDKVVTPEPLFRDRSPLQCPVQDCSQQFPTFAELEEHSARLHRRYLCSYCGKSFTAKPNRDRHVRVHTGVKPYKCHICSQAFYRGDDLKYHVTTKHPRDIDY